jgi:hypothetical protein
LHVGIVRGRAGRRRVQLGNRIAGDHLVGIYDGIVNTRDVVRIEVAQVCLPGGDLLENQTNGGLALKIDIDGRGGGENEGPGKGTVVHGADLDEIPAGLFGRVEIELHLILPELVRNGSVGDLTTHDGAGGDVFGTNEQQIHLDIGSREDIVSRQRLHPRYQLGRQPFQHRRNLRQPPIGQQYLAGHGGAARAAGWDPRFDFRVATAVAQDEKEREHGDAVAVGP